jgi:hypothetical protein
MFFTSQKRQLRVHFSPRIMKLAVEAPQHSALFGQLPLTQMVLSCWLAARFFSEMYSFPDGSGVFIQAGSLRTEGIIKR